LLSRTINPVCEKTLKVRKIRKACKDLGTHRQHSGEFPGFSFCFLCLRLGVQEASNQETPMSTEKRPNIKSSLQRTGKKEPEPGRKP
jgi:hypothetical protein